MSQHLLFKCFTFEDPWCCRYYPIIGQWRAGDQNQGLEPKWPPKGQVDQAFPQPTLMTCHFHKENMCSIDKSIHRDFPYHPPNTKRSRCVLLTRLAEGCRSTCCSNVSHLKTHGAADTTHMTSDEAKTLNPTCYALSSELVVEDSEEDEPFGASSLSSGKHLRHLTAFNGPPKSES